MDDITEKTAIASLLLSIRPSPRPNQTETKNKRLCCIEYYRVLSAMNPWSREGVLISNQQSTKNEGFF